jgi:hypothetical protein
MTRPLIRASSKGRHQAVQQVRRPAARFVLVPHQEHPDVCVGGNRDGEAAEVQVHQLGLRSRRSEPRPQQRLGSVFRPPVDLSLGTLGHQADRAAQEGQFAVRPVPVRFL